ncbi:MAG: hypothetical protein R3324_09715 [Halobacteriales archaeon]|nr:hypothetical protein [Halobacteriales archaeon]
MLGALQAFGLPAQAQEGSWLRPRAQEVALARSAAPTAVSDDATVWVLRSDGFEVASKGGNGFHCMVRRVRDPRDVVPVCFNPAAAERVKPVWQQVVVDVMDGGSFAASWEAAMDSLDSGVWELPEAGRALAYMMSAEMRLYDPDTGGERRYFPHVMVFSPYLTDADIGASREEVDDVRVPFVAYDGQAGAYLMIPTGPVASGIAAEAAAEASNSER